jgi:hypothetical protein
MAGKTKSAAERNEAARERAFMSPNSLVHFALGQGVMLQRGNSNAADHVCRL